MTIDLDDGSVFILLKKVYLSYYFFLYAFKDYLARGLVLPNFDDNSSYGIYLRSNF